MLTLDVNISSLEIESLQNDRKRRSRKNRVSLMISLCNLNADIRYHRNRVEPHCVNTFQFLQSHNLKISLIFDRLSISYLKLI
jgi:hypothetical protein